MAVNDEGIASKPVPHRFRDCDKRKENGEVHLDCGAKARNSTRAPNATVEVMENCRNNCCHDKRNHEPAND